MKIAPFRGYRYRIGEVRDVSAVVAPPYDQIGPETQARLYAMSPDNIVRVTLGREEPGVDSEEELYHPEDELGVIWNDPDIGVAWPIAAPTLSVKDATLPRLRDVEARLPELR